MCGEVRRNTSPWQASPPPALCRLVAKPTSHRHKAGGGKGFIRTVMHPVPHPISGVYDARHHHQHDHLLPIGEMGE